MHFNRSVSFEKLFGSVFFSHMLIRVHLYICINIWVLLLTRYVAQPVKQTTKSKYQTHKTKICGSGHGALQLNCFCIFLRLFRRVGRFIPQGK